MPLYTIIDRIKTNKILTNQCKDKLVNTIQKQECQNHCTNLQEEATPRSAEANGFQGVSPLLQSQKSMTRVLMSFSIHWFVSTLFVFSLSINYYKSNALGWCALSFVFSVFVSDYHSKAWWPPNICCGTETDSKLSLSTTLESRRVSF